LRNKTITFGIVKPLNCAGYCFRHNITLLLDYICVGFYSPTGLIVG
jgi:hypothetical protein